MSTTASLRIITADLGGRIYWTWTWGGDPGVAFTPWESIEAVQQLLRSALPGQAEPDEAVPFDPAEVPAQLLKLSGLTAEGELADPEAELGAAAALDAARIGQVSEGRRAQVRMAHRCLSGPLSNREAAMAWAHDLADVLLPPELVAEIVERSRAGRIDLAIMPSALCNAVPWEILPIDQDRVLLDVADIVSYAPVTQRELDGFIPNLWEEDHSKPALRIIDPDSDGEGRSFVLDPQDQHTWEARAGGRDVTRVGQHYDRSQLSVDLRGNVPAPRSADRVPGQFSEPKVSRFFYLGHVTSPSNDAKSSSLMLGCEARTYGTSGLSGRVRGFSAGDALLGTINYREEVIRQSLALKQEPDWDQYFPDAAYVEADDGGRELAEVAGSDLWPMPSRVALVACHSGSDFGHPEPFGLVTAFFESGAELITATRWTIITDRVFDCYTPGMSRHPVQEAALRVDEAHSSTDPVGTLGQWQRDRLAAWRAEGQLADSPLTWAAFTTYRWQPRVTELPPELQTLFDEGGP